MKKKTNTNINELKCQRGLNVQEQLILKKHDILLEATYWRKNSIPSPLGKIFAEKGIDINSSIILEYEQDYPGISTDEGIVLTNDKRFYKFDVDLNSNRSELVELYSFKDISDKFEVNGNKKGIGKTYGFLAMEVLEELNKEQE